VQLPREPSRRDSRYAHLLSGEIDVPNLPASAEPVELRAKPPQSDRIARLEEMVSELRRELDELKEKLGA
jgi:uncharacterized protein YceH (UPF0502 family)